VPYTGPEAASIKD